MIRVHVYCLPKLYLYIASANRQIVKSLFDFYIKLLFFYFCKTIEKVRHEELFQLQKQISLDEKKDLKILKGLYWEYRRTLGI